MNHREPKCPRAFRYLLGRAPGARLVNATSMPSSGLADANGNRTHSRSCLPRKCEKLGVDSRRDAVRLSRERKLLDQANDTQ
jgi:hypothetical protein